MKKVELKNDGKIRILRNLQFIQIVTINTDGSMPYTGDHVSESYN